jgi:hypothetical protein
MLSDNQRVQEYGPPFGRVDRPSGDLGRIGDGRIFGLILT